MVSVSRNGSTLHLGILPGSDNAILPAIRTATRFREICRAKEGKLDPPRRPLDFKIYEVENPHGFNAFAQIIDIETGKSIDQRESKVVGLDDAALADPMQDAAEQLGVMASPFVSNISRGIRARRVGGMAP